MERKNEMRKRYWMSAVFLMGILMFGFSDAAMAANTIQVFVNEEPVVFSDQSPVLENGRALVPMRAIFETMGAEIEWDAPKKTVRAFWGIDSLELTVGSLPEFQFHTRNVRSCTAEDGYYNHW